MQASSLPRPGGRSSRVKEAVFKAVEDFLIENPGDLPSMAEIAARARVNPSSLYRRWGDTRVLAVDVAVDRLMRDLPIPDTGSLRGDLIGWASAAAQSLSSRRNIALLRIWAAAPMAGGSLDDLKALPTGRRITELEAMLQRARKRGEDTLSVMDVLELVLAPVYLHALFLGPMQKPEETERLVDRALAFATPSLA